MIDINNDFDYLLSSIGKDIQINDTPARVIIQQEKASNDILKIYTKDFIARGNIIIYNNNNYIVTSEITNKKYDSYYFARARHCPYDVKFVINGLYLIPFPAFIDSKVFDMTTGKYFDITDGTIFTTIQDNTDTSLIKEGDEFVKLGKQWSISGIDKTEKGLIKLTCTIKEKTSGTDLTNEIPDTYIKPTIKISNANPSTYTIGTPLQITATVTQGTTTVTNAKIDYISSNPDIATIDNNGLVNGIVEGSTTITAQLHGTDIKDSIVVNTNKEIQHNYTITVSGTTSADIPDDGSSIFTYTATVKDNGIAVSGTNIPALVWNQTEMISKKPYPYITLNGNGTTATLSVPSTVSAGKHIVIVCALASNTTIFGQIIVTLSAGF